MEAQAPIVGIPVYVISLKDSETRRRNITARLNAAGIPFRFVDAVDGRFHRVLDQIDGARVVRGGFHSESALACAASHRLVHRMIVEGGSKMALVLEDDAQFSEDFPDALAAAQQLDFDVLNLEGGPWGRRTSIGKIGRYSVLVGTPSLGAAAYLIRRSAAVRFCALPVLDQITDTAFGDLRLSLRVLDLEPYPITQDKRMPSQLDFQQYPLQLTRKLSWFEQMALSTRKRKTLVRLYGFRVALALELQKFGIR